MQGAVGGEGALWLSEASAPGGVCSLSEEALSRNTGIGWRVGIQVRGRTVTEENVENGFKP